MYLRTKQLLADAAGNPRIQATDFRVLYVLCAQSAADGQVVFDRDCLESHARMPPGAWQSVFERLISASYVEALTPFRDKKADIRIKVRGSGRRQKALYADRVVLPDIANKLLELVERLTAGDQAGQVVKWSVVRAQFIEENRDVFPTHIETDSLRRRLDRVRTDLVNIGALERRSAFVGCDRNGAAGQKS